MALAQAILAALLDRECSGYDLRKRFEGTVGFFWQASFQQIYRELTRLEDQGLVQSQTVAQQGRPDKKLFVVTEAGRAALQDWIAQPCDMAPLRDDLLVKLFAGFVAPTAILRELARHQQLHQERLAIYRQIQQTAFAQPDRLTEKELFRYLTLLSGIQFEEGWLIWCEQALNRLSEATSDSLDRTPGAASHQRQGDHSPRRQQQRPEADSAGEEGPKRRARHKPH